ncbi:hypothetical protein UCD39_09880 [Nitrospirillum sp. BR 11752]|uniref:hypothetical protein n=1 Tax=Nitrospirillum sp. BR 11752 TaxID=3104293 RepID=UPI002E9DB4AA|nr:hypothetical protein [Nitrospirillum sp. BR 11752]
MGSPLPPRGVNTRTLFTALALPPGDRDRDVAATPHGGRLEELYWPDHDRRLLTGHHLTIDCAHRHDLEAPMVGSMVGK